MRCHLRAALCATFFCTVSHAGLVERDWLAPGDGLLTFDPSTGLEWLDVSETLLEDFPAGTLVEDRYQAVVAQTLPGGMFEGFSVAGEAQAAQLARSAGIIPNTSDFASNQAAVAGLFSLVGSTESIPGRTERLHGLLSEVTDDVRPFRNGLFVQRDPDLGLTRQSAGFGVQIAYRVDDSLFPNPNANFAVLLARPVPEPSMFTLACVSVFVNSLRSRRRKNRQLPRRRSRTSQRSLRFESCEGRRMLATADVVFLVDES